MFMGKKLNIIRMPILFMLIFRSHAIKIKNLVGSFLKLNEMILKFTGKSKGPRLAQGLIKKIIRLELVSRERKLPYETLTNVNRKYRNRPMCV